jgi:hypothetical protein
MTKSEKRVFRIFAERIQESNSLSYMRLFDLMDKQKILDEESIKSKLGIMTSSQYSNLKRHLYRQILKSLRHLNIDKRPNIKMREHIDFAYVLYGKGLYMHALKNLEKAKQIAKKHHHDLSLLSIYEIEKMIHSRHITRTKLQPETELIQASQAKIISISNQVALSNLRISMHAFYIKNGHVQNDAEENTVRRFFENNLPSINYDVLGHMEKIYLYQSYVWYYYTLNDFERCYQYAQKWVELFKQNQELQFQDINLFLRGYHYVLTGAYNLKDKVNFEKYRNELETFRKTYYYKFPENTRIISFLYTHTARMNAHFLAGTFSAGVENIGRTLSRLERYRLKLDEHKIMVLYYKIAWMYLANGQPEKATPYLHDIISMTNITLRIDIQAYARLLCLMAHHDMDNSELIKSMLRSYANFFKKNKLNNPVQHTMLRFFKEIINTPILDKKQIMQSYLDQLNELSNDKYAKRAFLYLDSSIWLQSKIENKSIGSILGAE